MRRGRCNILSILACVAIGIGALMLICLFCPLQFIITVVAALLIFIGIVLLFC
ncbi:hypothetical protein [Candidatus Soleaferrea massiliensis]|uniref:hypothetical protein n=1 Tax=Candidatus Soleaferrea massiliensis TaxID=1470354 RepID=UPI0012E01571|nr:hypothetical protein [Candidatus Soleaferrea massiliensis]